MMGIFISLYRTKFHSRPIVKYTHVVKHIHFRVPRVNVFRANYAHGCLLMPHCLYAMHRGGAHHLKRRSIFWDPISPSIFFLKYLLRETDFLNVLLMLNELCFLNKTDMCCVLLTSQCWMDGTVKSISVKSITCNMHSRNALFAGFLYQASDVDLWKQQ